MKVHPKYVKQGVIQNANSPIAFLCVDAFSSTANEEKDTMVGGL